MLSYQLTFDKEKVLIFFILISKKSTEYLRWEMEDTNIFYCFCLIHVFKQHFVHVSRQNSKKKKITVIFRNFKDFFDEWKGLISIDQNKIKQCVRTSTGANPWGQDRKGGGKQGTKICGWNFIENQDFIRPRGEPSSYLYKSTAL